MATITQVYCNSKYICALRPSNFKQDRAKIEPKIQDEKKASQDDLGPVLERSWVVLGRHLGRKTTETIDFKRFREEQRK